MKYLNKINYLIKFINWYFVNSNLFIGKFIIIKF
jgi:hypothetical protein